MAQLDGGSYLGLLFWTLLFWMFLGLVICGWRGIVWNVVARIKGLMKLEVYHSKNRCRVDSREGLRYMVYHLRYYEVNPPFDRM